MTSEFRTLRNASQAGALSLAMSVTPIVSVLADSVDHTDRATITVPSPRSANLLQLRGIGGHGSADVLLDGACYTMPVRLVAGDFKGLRADIQYGEPIVLEIRDVGLVRALMRGTDIVSDELDVSTDPSDQKASILLMSGLEDGTGFVINPGRSILADLFGAPVTETPCNPLERPKVAEHDG